MFEEPISRRKFITDILKVGGGGILALTTPIEALAKLSDILEYEEMEVKSYAQGVSELQEAVFKSPHEIQRFYVRAKQKFQIKTGGLFGIGSKTTETQEGWYRGKGGKEKNGFVYTPFKSFQVLLDNTEDLEYIGIFHTHPKEEINTTQCFSSGDIWTSLQLAIMYPNAMQKTNFELLEPTGHWKYNIDIKNQSMSVLLQEIRNTEETIAKLPKEDKDKLKLLIIEDYKKLLDIKRRPEDITNEELLEMMMNVVAKEKEIPCWTKLKSTIRNQHADLKNPKNQEENQEGINEKAENLIQILKPMGISLTYNPYNSKQ